MPNELSLQNCVRGREGKTCGGGIALKMVNSEAGGVKGDTILVLFLSEGRSVGNGCDVVKGFVYDGRGEATIQETGRYFVRRNTYTESITGEYMTEREEVDELDKCILNMLGISSCSTFCNIYSTISFCSSGRFFCFLPNCDEGSLT